MGGELGLWSTGNSRVCFCLLGWTALGPAYHEPDPNPDFVVCWWWDWVGDRIGHWSTGSSRVCSVLRGWTALGPAYHEPDPDPDPDFDFVVCMSSLLGKRRLDHCSFLYIAALLRGTYHVIVTMGGVLVYLFIYLSCHELGLRNSSDL